MQKRVSKVIWKERAIKIVTKIAPVREILSSRTSVTGTKSTSGFYESGELWGRRSKSV